MLTLPIQPTLAVASAWLVTILAIGFSLTCLFMILIILVQKPKGGGLSGAFGGAGGGTSEAAFGAKVGDVLTWMTVGFFVAFLLFAMGLTWVIDPGTKAKNQPQTPVQQSTGAGASSKQTDQKPAKKDQAGESTQGSEGQSKANQKSAENDTPTKEK